MNRAQRFNAGDLPFLTAGIPGIGGQTKTYDEDFIVEEVPRYAASGTGTHVYVTIEKQGLTTPEAIGILAKHLGKRPRDFGYAGLKDAHGITQQRLSVEHVDPAKIEALDLAQIRVCAVSRHTNKIKLGHLAANRFVIRLRGCEEDPVERARAVMTTLAQRGVPNYFGAQRFGVRGDNADVGLAVLGSDHARAMSLILGRPESFERPEIREARRLFDEGNYDGAARAWPHRFSDQAHLCRVMADTDGDAQRAWRAVRQNQRTFYFSALQSMLFNQVLARRIAGIDQLVDGDVAWIHRNGACFLVDNAEVEQPRCTEFDISPTGPLFGKKMKATSALAAQWEDDVLRDAGMVQLQIESPERARLDGARRPLRVPPTDTSVEAGTDGNGPFVQVAFTLPPGAYATVVTREITKSR